MIDKYKNMLSLFDPNYIKAGSDSDVSVEEVEPNGAGVATFTVSGDYILIKGCCSSASQIIWLSEQKCADGCIITFPKEGHVEIRIVELKSKLGPDAWKKAQSQFKGMLLNCIAFFGFLGEQPAEIKVDCYIVFKEDKLSNIPILNKAFTGFATGLETWDSPTLSLPLGIKADFHKHLRNPDAHLGAV